MSMGPNQVEGVLTPSGQRFQARIRMKGSVVDPQSRTIEVLADVLKGPGPAIRPGSLANVDFGGFGEKDGLYLPAGAVRADARGSHVLVAAGGFVGYIVLSAIKGDLQLKDRGAMTPGRGGVLNRIDTIIYTAPLYFFIVSYLYY